MIQDDRVVAHLHRFGTATYKIWLSLLAFLFQHLDRHFICHREFSLQQPVTVIIHHLQISDCTSNHPVCHSGAAQCKSILDPVLFLAVQGKSVYIFLIDHPGNR